MARLGRTQAEAKINAHRADRGRPVGRPNTHPPLTTQRASVHAGPRAWAGPTAGPPRPDLMGSHRETGVLSAAGLAAIMGISHYAERPREARERGLCDEIHINVHGDKPRMHSTMGAVPVDTHID